LFALARDAQINVDISPRVQGEVTLNAVEQTLPQILDRISRQISLRYEVHDRTISVTPDEPYLQTYKVNYVNMQREMKDTISVATQINSTGTGNVGGGTGGSGGGGSSGGAGLNNSTTTVTSVSTQRFWSTIAQNIRGILGKAGTGSMGTDQYSSDELMVSPESGIVTVRATAKQQAQIRVFIDQMLENASRQVLIEATVVEVELKNDFQAGIDWEFLRGAGSGFGGAVNLLSPIPAGDITSGVLNYINAGPNGIKATLNLLNNFGDTKVLSSPRLMVLNNQTAVLKVVENLVYFSTDVKVGPTNALNSAAGVAINTRAETVPVGLVMTVTPQINDNHAVMLNVRPTISDVVKTVSDPNPQLTRVTNSLAGTTERLENLVPQIRVREMESMLKINSGQIAVLGGLIQDRVQKDTNKLPGIAELPVVGDIFFRGRSNQFKKTELVIFLRPVVVDNPSVANEELQDYRPFLERRTDVPPPR
jgi:MSHA biogenesis protein MshL